MKEINKMYHINLSKEDLMGAKYAILPGDPFRVNKIAMYLDNAQYLGSSREYTAYLGDIKNEKVLVILYFPNYCKPRSVPG